MKSPAVEQVEDSVALRIRWVNPYRLRLGDYPGRIFCFDQSDLDTQTVRALCADAKQVYCEIGSGSGNHMIELGRRAPDALVFGFELRYKRAVRTIQKAEALTVHKVYVLRTKGQMIDAVFPRGSLDAVYINFPDPWDRKRWKKHQILNLDLLEKLDAVLRPQGMISLKTDHPEYFHNFLELVARDARFVVQHCTEDLYSSEYLRDNIASEFENLFCADGVAICYARLVRTGRTCL